MVQFRGIGQSSQRVEEGELLAIVYNYAKGYRELLWSRMGAYQADITFVRTWCNHPRAFVFRYDLRLRLPSTNYDRDTYYRPSFPPSHEYIIRQLVRPYLTELTHLSDDECLPADSRPAIDPTPPLPSPPH